MIFQLCNATCISAHSIIYVSSLLFWKFFSCTAWDACLVGNLQLVSFGTLQHITCLSVHSIIYIFYLSLTVCSLGWWAVCFLLYTCFIFVVGCLLLSGLKQLFGGKLWLVSFGTLQHVYYLPVSPFILSSVLLSMFSGVSSCTVCNICLMDDVLFPSFSLSFLCSVFLLP